MPTTLGRWTGGARRARASARRERGQVLILFVMGATVIFAIGAIVVDIGLWVSERRNAQAAADLAALAAATQLRDPTDPSAAAIAKGLDFAKRNGYEADSKVRVDVFPDLSNDTVKVEIEEHGGSLFAGIFGITNMDVGATAIGKYVPSTPGPGWALFVRDQNCSRGNALDYLADDSTVDGAAHSNATIHIGGKDNSFNGPVNWVCSNGFVDEGGGNTYQPIPSQVGIQPAPVNYSYGSFGCKDTFNSDTTINNVARLWVGDDPNSKQLKDSVICSTGTLSLAGDGITGRVTLVARGALTIDGNNNDLEPYLDISQGHNVLAFSEATPGVARDAIEINANGGTYKGYIHAPNSEAEITGYGDVTIAGSVVADTIRIRGDHLNFNASGYLGPTPPPNIHLED